ncbi:hypothetical protein MRX96_033680 [Rhipicephalus microplus]
MYRNQYDNDVTVAQATIGLKSNTHAVLLALKRASSELSAHQKKIIPIDNHVGVSIAGLTADARLLSKFMRSECLSNRYAHDTPLPISRLVTLLGNKMQVCTQRYDRRPYGVGLLVAGYDDMGAHIYQTCPSANFFDCKAMAIGARSQSARTYLEKHLDEFKLCNLEELVKHGLRALRDCLPNEVELSTKNVSIAIVGKDHDFTIYDDDRLASIEGEEDRRQPPGDDDAPPPAPPAVEEKGPADPIVAVATEERMEH